MNDLKWFKSYQGILRDPLVDFDLELSALFVTESINIEFPARLIIMLKILVSRE
jgi:hypothetical protein